MYEVTDAKNRISPTVVKVDGLKEICRKLGRSPGWTSMASTEEVLDYLIAVERLDVRRFRG